MSSPRCSSGSSRIHHPPRTASAAVERWVEFAAEDRACDRVRRCRSRVRVERSVHDLGDFVRRRVDDVLVRCPAPRERFAPGCDHHEPPVPGSDPTLTRSGPACAPRRRSRLPFRDRRWIVACEWRVAPNDLAGDVHLGRPAAEFSRVSGRCGRDRRLRETEPQPRPYYNRPSPRPCVVRRRSAPPRPVGPGPFEAKGEEAA